MTHTPPRASSRRVGCLVGIVVAALATGAAYGVLVAALPTREGGAPGAVRPLLVTIADLPWPQQPLALALCALAFGLVAGVIAVSATLRLTGDHRGW